MKMDELFGGVPSSKVAEFEKEFDLRLPQDYRDFLLSVGGSVADREDETNGIPVEEMRDEVELAILYGIDNSQNDCTAEYWMREYNDEIWPKSVLFGESMASGFFVLVCEGEDTGVWFWDDCWEYEATNEKKNTYFVAKSFTEFINLLGGKLELPDGRVWKPTEA